MKARFALATAIALTGLVTLASAVTEKEMMAEMEKCEMCKHIAAKPDLMKDMTWETHKIDNGMLCVSTVPKEKKGEFDRLGEEMKESMAVIETAAKEGKAVELCELCAGWGELMKAGAKEKEIPLTNGSIHMITSDDPAVVAKIHAEADKAIAIQKDLEGEKSASL